MAEEADDITLTLQSQTHGLTSGTIIAWVVTATGILVLLIAAFTAIVVIKKRRTARQRALHQQSSVGSAVSVGSNS